MRIDETLSGELCIVLETKDDILNIWKAIRHYNSEYVLYNTRIDIDIAAGLEDKYGK